MLMPVCLIFLVTGNCAAGTQLALCDEATAPRTPIIGTITRIISENRVILTDVSLPKGRTTKRPVVVTLMEEEGGRKTELPKPGQRVSGMGRLFAQDSVRNPGGADDRLRALGDGYELSGYLLPGWTAEGKAVFSVHEAFRQMRTFLTCRLEQVLGEDAAVYIALLLGEKDGVDRKLKGAMRLTGTIHLLSVSGMHLSMIANALHALLRRLPIGRKAAYAIQAAVLLFFAGLTGFAVGAVRALLMQLLRLLARIRGRRYDPLTSLSLAALLITMASPVTAFDAGFQFSFFVVLGIHLLGKAFERLTPVRWLYERNRALTQMLVVSLSAQLAAIPLQLSLYGYVPLLALPMNLICSFFLPLLMADGAGALLLAIFAPGAAAQSSVLLVLPARVFERMSLWAAEIPGGVLRLPAPGWAALLLFALAMALLSPRICFGRGRYRALGAVTVLMAALYATRFSFAPAYVQLDVGQGDAAVIRSGRKAVVVDVGPAYSYDLLYYLRNQGLFVDTLVLSHMDEDHAGALSILLDSEVDVGCVIMAERAEEDVASDAVREGLALLEEKGVEIETVKAGDSFEAAGFAFDVLSPTDALTGSNERSLLLSVEAAGTDLLLCGDLTQAAEPDGVPACDVLKVAHHGSRYASSEAFLAQASPQIAIISVGGGNSYGHPHARVLEDLESIDAQTLRTDECGCVTVILGEALRVETFLQP